MCGIAGFVDFACESIEREPVLRAMLKTIIHRGPDDSGVLIDGVVSIGHRRLAVVELSPLGRQPMRLNDGRFSVSFNGEIYNYHELRRDLEAAGHTFIGNSDTEVLLALMEKEGLEAALRKCVGMFALAAWDRRARVLQLARDRFGEKPLYYGVHGGVFLFGSELKALASHRAFVRRVDPCSVEQVLRFGYTPAPHSIFERTFKLSPGSILTMHVPCEGNTTKIEDSCVMEVKSFWSHQEVALAGLERPFRGTFEDATEELNCLLSEAVRLQTQADVPLGALLSGGVDSSSVVALMQRSSPRPVRTFSIGFSDPNFNEAGYAKAVSSHIGTQHRELYVGTAEALQVIPKLPVMYDEPLADPSQIPTFLVARLARSEVTVALSGDGADEIFAGYPRYAFGDSIATTRGRRAVGGLLKLLQRSKVDALVRVLAPALRKPLARGRLEQATRLMGAQQSGRIAEILSEVNRNSQALLRWPTHRESAFTLKRPATLASPYVRLATLLDRETYLTDCVLHKVDRATMAVSLESRAPFLDHRIAEFAASLPSSYLMAGGEGKRVLKALLFKLVPRSLVDRPKAGFGIPLAQWLKGELREWGWDLLSTKRMHELLDMNACARMFEAHLEGNADLSLACWGVFSVLAWAEEWL